MMPARRSRHALPIASITTLLILAAAVLAGGCAASPGPGAKQKQLSIDELDQLTFAYADRYMTLVSSACDDIARDNSNPEQRLYAAQVKHNCCSAIYDIATAPDPLARLLDLTLVVTLQSQVWIDDGRADATFGACRGEPLVHALHRARQDIWKIAERALTVDQREGLDHLILKWRRDNPGIRFVGYVRFENVASTRAKAVAAEIRQGHGMLAKVDEARQSIDAARKTTERAFYFGKRLPILLGWQQDMFVEQTLQKPPVATLLDNVNALPKTVDATLVSLDNHAPNIRAILDQARDLANSVHGTAAIAEHIAQNVRGGAGATPPSAQQMPTSSDAINAAYQDPPAGNAPTPPATRQAARSFDINNYDHFAQHLGQAARDLNELAKSIDNLTSLRPAGGSDPPTGFLRWLAVVVDAPLFRLLVFVIFLGLVLGLCVLLPFRAALARIRRRRPSPQTIIITRTERP